MSRSKRFRVSFVTSEGNRAFARRDVNSRMETEQNTEASRDSSASTSHELKVTVERGKTRAECLNCNFKIAPKSAFGPVLFDCEDHGRISQLDCTKEHENVLRSWISAIRKGSVTRSDLNQVGR